MPTISGKEIAQIRANLAQSGHLQRAQESFLSNSQLTKYNPATTKNVQQTSGSSILKSLLGNKLLGLNITGDLTSGLAKKTTPLLKKVGASIFDTFAQKPIDLAYQARLAQTVQYDVIARQSYSNYLIAKAKRSEDPTERQSLLNQAVANSKFQPELDYLKGFSNRTTLQDVGTIGESIMIPASLLPITAGIKNIGFASKAGLSALLRQSAITGVETGLFTGVDSALRQLEEGKTNPSEIYNQASKSFGYGFAGGAAATPALTLLGRLGARIFKAKNAAEESLTIARETAKSRSASVTKRVEQLTKEEYETLYRNQRIIEKQRNEIAQEITSARETIIRKAGSQEAKIANEQVPVLQKELQELSESLVKIRKETGVRATEALSHQRYLELTSPKKIAFKTSQAGGGAKVPINVTKTAKILPAEIDDMLKLRKALDPDDVFTGQVVQEMQGAISSGAGKRVAIEGGETLAKASGFSSLKWVPDDLKSTKLFNQVVGDIMDGTLPKAGTKRAALYEAAQNEINRRLEMPADFTLDGIKQIKAGTKTLKDGTKITVGKDGAVTAERKISAGVGKDVEYTGRVGSAAPSKAAVKEAVAPTGSTVSANIPKPKPKPKTKAVPVPTSERTGSSIDRLKSVLKDVKSLNKEQKKIYSIERSEKFKASEVAGQAAKGEEALAARKAQLKGELSKLEIEPLRDKLSKEDVENLFEEINKTTKLLPGQKINAMEGLQRLLEGRLPQENQRKMLAKVFGEDLLEDLVINKGTVNKVISGIVDVLSVPRSIIAGTFDFAASFIQGGFLAARHPKIWGKAFIEQFKYFAKNDIYKAAMKGIQDDPVFAVAESSGLDFMELGSSLLKRDEQFRSQLAERIPGLGRLIKRSGRAFTGFTNKLRFDVFKLHYQYGTQTNLFKNNPDELKSIAKYLNNATGRGTAKWFEGSLAELGASAFFAPRLQIARFNTFMNPYYYYKLEPYARKEALKSLALYFAAGSSILGATKLLVPDVEVGIDPRSSDFGKIKYGNTRINIWGGNQQLFVLLARNITKEMISSTTGEKYKLGEGYKPLTRLDVLTRFLEMKTAPVPSFAISWYRGTNMFGDKFEGDVELANRVIPMMAGDIYDLYKEWGPAGLPFAIPGLFGIGVQTYGTKEFASERNAQGKLKIRQENVSGLSEDLLDWIKRTSVDEAAKHVENYEKVRTLMRQGKTSEAAKITGSMSEEEYDAYKQIAKEFEKDMMNDMRSAMNDKVDKVLELLNAGRMAEASDITEKFTPTEYKLYKELYKERLEEQGLR